MNQEQFLKPNKAELSGPQKLEENINKFLRKIEVELKISKNSEHTVQNYLICNSINLTLHEKTISGGHTVQLPFPGVDPDHLRLSYQRRARLVLLPARQVG